ncbi:PQQ-binding-like beta-propeller repeat protein [Planotetraspora phitsanulokensis]|nr:PQQ-binding-like beta-propeller repeat protein [Planotetraspora phitsanulokensis]
MSQGADRVDGRVRQGHEEMPEPERRAGEQEPAGRALRAARGPLIVVAALALAVSGWLVWTHLTRFHEHISGAQGAFPEALGNEAPSAPSRVMRTTSDTYGVLGGLTIDPSSDGVVARDLRTGNDYWRYGRDGAELGEVSFADGTVALWWKDDVVVGVDPRSGRPRWHAEAPYDGGSAAFDDVRATDGRVVTANRHRLDAFSENDGALLWTAMAPEGCEWRSGVRYAMPGVLVTPQRCGGDSVSLVALDAGRGTERWRLPQGLNDFQPADDHTLATGLWQQYGQGAVVDLSGPKPAIHTLRIPDDHVTVGAGSGVLLTLATTDRALSDPIQAYGLSDGWPTWSYEPTEGTTLGGPLIVQDRVYVVRQPLPERTGQPRQGRTDLLVLDVHTGRLLHSMRLPDRPPSDGDLTSGRLAVRQARDGVVGIGWSGTAIFNLRSDRLLIVTD